MNKSRNSNAGRQNKTGKQSKDKKSHPHPRAPLPQDTPSPPTPASPPTPSQTNTTPLSPLAPPLTLEPPASVCCVAFLTPALRALHTGQAAALRLCSGRLGAPPPGFLAPTRYLAAGLTSGRLALWDLERRSCVSQWDAHTPNAVVAVTNVRRGQFATLGAKHALRVWSATCAAPCNAPANPKRSPGNAKHASGNSKHAPEMTVVCLYDIALPEYPESLGGDGFDLFTEGSVIVMALPKGKQRPHTVEVRAVDQAVDQVVSELRFKDPGNVGEIVKLKWVEKKSKVVLMVGYKYGTLSVWCWANQVIRCSINFEGTLLNFEYDSSKGKGVACLDNKVCVFAMSSSLILSVVKTLPHYGTTIERCLTRHDGKYFVASNDHAVRLFSWSSQQLVSTLDWLRESSVSCVHFSYSPLEGGFEGSERTSSQEANHVLAVGSLDGVISLWNME